MRPPVTPAQFTKRLRTPVTICGSPVAGVTLLAGFGGRLRRGIVGLRGTELGSGGRGGGARPRREVGVERRGRYAGAVRDSSARRSASAVGHRFSGSFSRQRITEPARSSGTPSTRSPMYFAVSVICLIRMAGTVDA